MSWALLIALVLILGMALLVVHLRRAELARMEERIRKRDTAVRQGSAEAQLQHPVIDLSRCLGCATCVAACPEDGVLEIVHGQALVVNGARCMGISSCERECPVGAVTVTLTNVKQRTDIPALTHGLEAVGSPGLFLAGEVTAHALIKTAIEQGSAVGSEVARRAREEPKNGALDLCIVGAGPAGLACSLEAKRHGLSFVTLDQESGGAGGTVAKYPRRKLVLTQPVEMPLYGRLESTEYTKEELIELWRSIAVEHALPLRGGEEVAGLERDASGHYSVRTGSGTYTAKNVCLALGRRGSPRKLGVPGEDLPKVAYSLLDAQSYRDRRILVVGGGDSAVEAAMGLAEQPGNVVTLSYRKEAFFRIRGQNERRLEACVEAGKLQVVFQSRVLAIAPGAVTLEVQGGEAAECWALPNDDVFVMVGGIPPFELLERSGVSFDPSLREEPAPLVEQGTGLVRALAIGFGLSLLALLWALWHADYYTLPRPKRPAHVKHDLLRPSQGMGFFFGLSAVLLIGGNLVYLVRRSPRFQFQRGSLGKWMTSHVATGILAFLFALLHGAMAPRDTVGGHALGGLVVLLLSGAIGRYFYAYVPRAANGRELELEEVKASLGRVSAEWDGSQRRYRERARDELVALIEKRQWKSSFLGRVFGWIGAQRDLRSVQERLTEEGRAEGIPNDQIQDMLALARRAHRSALIAAHFEDVRSVLNTWRYVHRWVAALMVLLVVVHVIYAVVYGASFSAGGGA